MANPGPGGYDKYGNTNFEPGDPGGRGPYILLGILVAIGLVGGLLTPLGDPPLFLGFLNGVSFFWTTVHLAVPTLFICVVLLALFYALDRYYYAKEEVVQRSEVKTPLSVDGVFVCDCTAGDYFGPKYGDLCASPLTLEIAGGRVR